MIKNFSEIKTFIFNKLNSSTLGPKQSFLIYWKAYGGLKALYKSIYFFISIILSLFIVLLNYTFFDDQWNWCELVTSIIPYILGFSLGGYAFLVGFGNERFLNILCLKNNNEDYSVYMKVSASFFHVIFIQFLSLFFAVLSKALHLNNFILFDFIGIFLFLYAILTIVSTSFAVLNLADWFDTMKNSNNN